MAGKDNLKPFVKGKPKTGGRKKGSVNKSTIIKEMMEAVIEIEDKEGHLHKGTAIELLIASAIRKGIATGDMMAIKDMLDRYVGKPVEKIEQTTEIKKDYDKPLEIKIVKAK